MVRFSKESSQSFGISHWFIFEEIKSKNVERDICPQTLRKDDKTFWQNIVFIFIPLKSYEMIFPKTN